MPTYTVTGYLETVTKTKFKFTKTINCSYENLNAEVANAVARGTVIRQAPAETTSSVSTLTSISNVAVEVPPATVAALAPVSDGYHRAGGRNTTPAPTEGFATAVVTPRPNGYTPARVAHTPGR